jgi:cytochrome c oxidase subunit 2
MADVDRMHDLSIGTSTLLTGPQSALDPHGPVAREIAEIAWLLFAGGGVIFALVMALVAVALTGRRGVRARLSGKTVILVGGIAFPLLVLTALLLRAFLPASWTGAGEAPLRIEVTGEQWWWRIRYLDAAGASEFVTANEIRIPVGRTVELSVRSADVIHSFWVPKLAGKVDMIPGQVNPLRLVADRAGVFRGQCAEYCGGAHARMALHVIAEPADTFEAWRALQRAPAAPPTTDEAERGRASFAERGCGVCHTIRGTEANGVRGPDLTHIGSRVSLGAGSLTNGVVLLAAWIGYGQQVKPENLMPSYAFLPADELDAIAAYLAGLR